MLTFVKSVCKFGCHISAVNDVGFQKDLSAIWKHMVENVREHLLRTVLVILLNKRSGFLIVSGGGDNGGGLWVPRFLLLFKICYKESNGTEEYAFLRFMEITGLIDTVDNTVGSVCLTRSTGDDEYHRLRQFSASLGNWCECNAIDCD